MWEFPEVRCRSWEQNLQAILYNWRKNSFRLGSCYFDAYYCLGEPSFRLREVYLEILHLRSAQWIFLSLSALSCSLEIWKLAEKCLYIQCTNIVVYKLNFHVAWQSFTGSCASLPHLYGEGMFTCWTWIEHHRWADYYGLMAHRL